MCCAVHWCSPNLDCSRARPIPPPPNPPTPCPLTNVNVEIRRIGKLQEWTDEPLSKVEKFSGFSPAIQIYVKLKAKMLERIDDKHSVDINMIVNRIWKHIVIAMFTSVVVVAIAAIDLPACRKCNCRCHHRSLPSHHRRHRRADGFDCSTLKPTVWTTDNE